MVFGGFVLASDHFDVVIKALPFKLMMIGSAAVGAFVIGNSATFIIATLKDIGKFVSGSKWKD